MPPYGAGGAWKPAPGVGYWPPRFPGDVPLPMSIEGRPPIQPPTPPEVSTGLGFNPKEWGPSPLDGPRTLNVGGRRFRIPRDSQVKVSRRAGVSWVHTSGLTYVLSESGVLKQSTAERAATPFELL